VGRQRIYRLEPGPLVELVGWLERFVRASGLERRLDALETEVYRTRRDHRAGRAEDRGATDRGKEHSA
jgi:hypothetical protein